MASRRPRALLAAALAAGVAADLVAPVAAAGPQQVPRVDLASAQVEAPQTRKLRLDDPAAPTLPLLGAFHNAEIERPGPVRLYLGGRWARARPWWTLALPGNEPSLASPEASELTFDAWDAAPNAFALPVERGDDAAAWSLARLADLGAMLPFSVGWPTLRDPAADDTFGVEPAKKEPPWVRAARLAAANLCRRRPVKFVRYGAEADTFPLVTCDGSVAPEALDRLTLMARPPEVPRPGDLLPDDPDPQTWARGEWLDQVRPVHPRLVWLLQKIADAFPWRTIYVTSGYRPPNAAKGGHSFHGEARAMDISIMGVRNEDLFRFCRTLDDVGCGYYPNSKFVHVDVRRPRTGHAFWVDASGPGEPSQYVDSWPGVVESGAMVWDARARDDSPY